jgi:hypothetical protein
LELLVDERAENRQAQSEEYRTPPGQAPLGAEHGALVPGNSELGCGIMIASAIAYGGHETTPYPARVKNLLRL